MLLKSRVGFAIAGVVVIGGISAVLAIRPMLPHGNALASNSPSSSATPTTAPTPRPTSTPAPTRTPIPTLDGIVGTKGSNSFVLQLGGGATKTVIVNGSTVYRYNGSPSTLSALTQGWHAEVRGAYQTDGTFLASRVNSCSGIGCDT